MHSPNTKRTTYRLRAIINTVSLASWSGNKQSPEVLRMREKIVADARAELVRRGEVV